ncbi:MULTISPECIES: hypothetical protein [Streptomyces]|uniref:LPXTG-motif cell wall anchor domain-containing protein n=1 Tax=Streptomyces cremeus TaxID=66881 RepID=A0ABV5PFK3_STRCM
MTALRPLLTATAAGGLLAALWFVPSANATVEVPQAKGRDQAHTQDRRETRPAAHGPNADVPGKAVHVDGTGGGAAPDQRLALADTGSVDTTPYLIGGTAFLGIGAGFVTYSVRRRGTSPA